jgi:hypothetical protein
LAHLIIRLSGRPSDLNLVLDVVGWGMLIAMPVIWLVIDTVFVMLATVFVR